VAESSLLYEEAQRLYDAGQFEEAIQRWEQIPPADPQYVDAQFAIRTARLQIQQITEEENSSFQTYTQFDSYIEQAEHLERQGKLQEALKLYEEARELEPQNVLLYNKIEELHELLEDAVERHKALGELYLSRGENEKAKAEWERLLQLEPSNELAKQRLEDLEVLTATSDRVFLQRGRSLMQKGQLNEAKAEFEKALQINATNERTRSYLTALDNVPFTEYIVQQGDTLSSIAAKYTKNSLDYRILADFNQFDQDDQLQIGQTIKIPHILGFREALAPDEEDILREITEADQNNPAESRGITPIREPAGSEELQQIFEQGVAAYNQGNYREAVTLFNRVYEQDPENLEAYDYFLRSLTILQRGSSGDEIVASSIPIQENSTTSEIEALIRTAKTHREAGKLKEAILTYEQALQLNPGYPEIDQQLEETRDELKKLITAHLNEGIKLFNQEALEEAILEWDKVLELDSSNQQAANYRAQAEKRLNALKTIN